ncbi:MAG: DUF3617 family protein [Alteraurantiacibacter sp. bin_em_oilr2.035]|nr:DUF3617 family protein [Alteraurantiacibacter sp. bin_em_oilr2.035]
MKRAAWQLASLALLLGAASAAFAGQDGADMAKNASVADDHLFPWLEFLDAEPRPGLYQVRYGLENALIADFDPRKNGGPSDPSMDEGDVEFICLDEDTQRVDMLEEFATGGCTMGAPAGGADGFTVMAQCRDPDGQHMRIRMTGSGDAEHLQTLLSMTMRSPERGKMALGIRVELERVGECE